MSAVLTITPEALSLACGSHRQPVLLALLLMSLRYLTCRYRLGGTSCGDLLFEITESVCFLLRFPRADMHVAALYICVFLRWRNHIERKISLQELDTYMVGFMSIPIT